MEMGTKWPEVDQVSIEPESLVSLVPIIEEGFALIRQMILSDPTKLICIYLFPLNEEIFKSIGLIWIVSQSIQRHLKSKITSTTNQTLLNFYTQIHETLGETSGKLEFFINFLISLRTDTQI